MDRDAYEWTYCSHTGKEKPPRAHYDHVTEKLVLNMDHYWCACMFDSLAASVPSA
jgi:FMN phosphatase YigB (HAD superfamily)